VKGAALEDGDAFGDELGPAVDEPRLLGAVLNRAAGDLVVIGLVVLSQVGCLRVRDRSFGAHPVERRARVETARKRDAHLLARGDALQNVRHVLSENLHHM
jgi:hypothetical protein